MIRQWITLMQGGREIERRVHQNERGDEYVCVHGKRLFINRLDQDGRLVNRYHYGAEETT